MALQVEVLGLILLKNKKKDQFLNLEMKISLSQGKGYHLQRKLKKFNPNIQQDLELQDKNRVRLKWDQEQVESKMLL